MPNVIKGKDLNLGVVVNGMRTPVCYAKTTTLNITRDTKEITGRGLGGYRDYIAGKASYSLETSGNFNAVPGNGMYFLQALLNGEPIIWWFSDGINIEWSGTLLVTSGSYDSPMDALASFNNSMIGKGKPNFKILSTANQDPDQSGSDGKPTLTGTDLESYFNTINFVYDGTNNIHTLSFIPRQVQGGSTLNNKAISPAIDYYFDGATVVLDTSNLIQDIEYTLTIFYFK
jgi:predicted secreted protein